MRILKILILVTALLFTTSTQAISDNSNQLTLDSEKSVLKWTGKKVTGQHNGTLKLKAGTIEIKDSQILGGNFELVMDSIVNEDIEDPTWKAKLENHLKSDDFFNVSKFPIGKFEITSSEGNLSSSNNSIKIKGNLTIKDISLPVEFPASITKKDDVYHAEAKVSIDRTKWDIRYKSGKFFDPANLGDKLIYDDIEIELIIVAS